MCITQRSSLRKTEFHSRFHPLLMFFFCLAGILLNITFTRLCFYTGFPLFLDTILTITITLIGGLFWGMLCGALTNVIYHSIWGHGWEAYLFAICNIATAYITWLFIRFFPRELLAKKEYVPQKPSSFLSKTSRLSTLMDRVIILILLSFALCLAMSILGGLIATFILYLNSYYYETDGVTGVFTATMFTQNAPIFVKEIVSRIPVNIIDRLISSFAGYGIAVCVRHLKSQ